MCKRILYLFSVVLVLFLFLFLSTQVVKADPFRQDPGPDGIVMMEAEHYEANVEVGGHTWEEVGPMGGFTGEVGMWSPNGNGFHGDDYVTTSEHLDYDIQFSKVGTHYVWVLAWGESGTDDSCHIGLDGEGAPTHLADRMTGWSANYRWANGRYQMPEVAQIEVTAAGVHTLNLYVREDGLIVDKILLTTNPNYTPSGQGPPESHRGMFLKAYDPAPADGELYLDTWVTLAWTPGETAASHDIYIGVDFDEVNDGAEGTFQVNQPGAFYVVGFPGFAFPEGLVPGTTYYWRIDEVEADGVTKHKGDVWSFTVPSRKAYNPQPANGAEYVLPEDVTLRWAGGLNAKLHHVYFGEDFNDVNDAAGALPQTDTTYDPGPLAMETTYYWRVDEFDGMAMHKGDVWSFSTLSEIAVVDPDLVGWWKFETGSGTTAIDFSGHGNHGTLEADSQGSLQWVSGMFNWGLGFLGDNRGWVELPPGMVTTSQGSILMWVNVDAMADVGMFWYGTETGGDGFGDENEIHIHVTGSSVGFHLEGGDNDVALSGPQVAGVGWTHVAATWDLTDGCRLYANGEQVDFAAHNNTIADLNVIRLGRPVGTGNGNRYYAGLMDDVRLFDVAIDAAQVNEIMSKGEDPLRAGSPNPRNGALVGINEATTISWSAGENAVEHDVYFGTDREAVVNADTSDPNGVYRGRQSETSYTPPEGVEWGGGPYYWRIDEVNTDGTITAGGIWSYSVLDYIPVDDFESYTDDDANGQAIWQHWIDGFGIADNGSQVGYLLPPYAEQTIVHGGGQSMPLMFDNTAGVTNSEAVLTLTSPRNWNQSGIDVLSLWFHGLPASVGSFVEGPAGTYTMTAAGTDIWGTADQFHYAYKTLTGAGSIIARVESVERADVWTKAGVMIRETLDPGSKFAAVYITPTNADGTPTQGCRFQARTSTDIDATSDTSVATAEQMAITAPYWVKLERDVTGNFRAYYASDGVNWRTLVWRPSMTIGSTAYVGLALTSHNAALTAQAVFSNVQTTGTVTGQWQSQDIGIVSNAAEPLYVAISNTAGSPAVAVHDDPAASTIDDWTEWQIPLQAFADQGINLNDVDKIAVGLGSKSGITTSGGTGTVYFDDIRLTRSEP